RTLLVKALLYNWGASEIARHNMVEALLRLGRARDAAALAHKMTEHNPRYPDSFAYLAIAAAREGNAREAARCLATMERMREENGRGLHLHMANWMHRELAAISEGERRVMHLLCAELARDRPLRPFKELVEAPSGTG